MMLLSAEQFLRAIAPDDLEGHGCYVVDIDEIASQFPELRRENVLAYTSPLLPKALQPWLEAQGRWVGDGFGCIVMRSEIRSWREVLGICVHELGHWLTSDPMQASDPKQAFKAVVAYAASDNSNEPWPPWIGHGRDFCRAAAHLAARAFEVMESVNPSLVRFSQQYTHVPESTWMTLLSSEFRNRGSIRRLLQQPAPERFNQLWNEIEAGI